MITSLTKEQSDRFPEFVKKWTEIGLSTKSLNKAKIKEGLKSAYAEVKKPSPKGHRLICKTNAKA